MEAILHKKRSARPHSPMVLALFWQAVQKPAGNEYKKQE